MMKPRKDHLKHLVLALAACAAAVIGAGPAAHAETFTYDFASQVKEGTAPWVPWTVNADDLLQTSLASVSYDPNPPAGDWQKEGCGSPSILNDGLFKMDGGDLRPFLTAAGNGYAVQYNLDTTASPAGYDISRIVTYGGWMDDGRDRQFIDVKYATVSDPETFSLLATVDADNAALPDNCASAIRATVTTSLTNVAAIRFEFPNGQENDWAGYGEFDVLGTPSASTKAPTTTVLSRTAGGNPANHGEALTFSATVTGSAPSGTVTFHDGTMILGTATLDAGAASITTSLLAIGTHSITVRYAGDDDNWPSTSAALTQTVVNPRATSTTLALTGGASPAAPGVELTFTATVAGPAPTGTVEFFDGATSLGVGGLNGSYQATITSSSLAAGAHGITAQYAGDANNDPSTSADLYILVASTYSGIAANLAPSGTAVRDGGGAFGLLNDKDNISNDLVNWVGITWGAEQTFHALHMQCSSEEGHYPAAVDLQVARAGVTSPNIDTDADWVTPAGWSLRGNTNDFLTVSSDSPIVTCGVRVKPVSGTWRPIELLVLSGVATTASPAATIAGLADWTTWGSAAMARLWDGDFFYQNQAGIENPAPPPVTYDWAAPQRIGAVMIAGGAGSYPTAYDVQYQDGEGGWQTAASVTGNTTQVTFAGFNPVTSQHFRVKLNATSDDQCQRISEIMLFTANGAAPPAAGFAGWIGTGGYGLTGPAAAGGFDYEGDGLDNGVEYVLGTDPTSPNGGGPVAATDGAAFVFTFQRALASKTPDTTVVIDVGTDLVNWTSVYPVDTAPEVTITPGAPGYETVTLRVLRASDASKFARMRVTVTP